MKIEDEIINNLTPHGHQFWIGSSEEFRRQYINEVATRIYYPHEGLSAREAAIMINSDAARMLSAETQEG